MKDCPPPAYRRPGQYAQDGVGPSVPVIDPAFPVGS